MVQAIEMHFSTLERRIICPFPIVFRAVGLHYQHVSLFVDANGVFLIFIGEVGWGSICFPVHRIDAGNGTFSNEWPYSFCA